MDSQDSCYTRGVETQGVQSVAMHPVSQTSRQEQLGQIRVWLSPSLARHLQYRRPSQSTRLVVEIQGLQLFAGQRIPVTIVRH